MRSIKVGERVVAIKELAFKEVRNWVKDAESMADQRMFDFVADAMPVEGVCMREVCRMTDLSQEEIDEMLPSQLVGVVVLCKELNPYFFQTRERVIAMAKTMQN